MRNESFFQIFRRMMVKENIVTNNASNILSLQICMSLPIGKKEKLCVSMVD